MRNDKYRKYGNRNIELGNINENGGIGNIGMMNIEWRKNEKFLDVSKFDGKFI